MKDVDLMALADALKPSLSKRSLRSLLGEKDANALSAAIKESLLSFARKAVEMRQAGVINDDEFATLIAYFCAVYVENEIEERVNKILDKKISLALPFSF